MSQFLIYKSSAGSGKTTALVGIFVRLCLADSSPFAFKRILAITFTIKAAFEMKERVMKEIERLNRIQLPLDDKDYQTLQVMQELDLSAEEIKLRAGKILCAMLHDYGDLSLGTIDKFNLKLIRSFSRELGLQGDFEVEMDERSIFKDAIKKVLMLAGKDEAITLHLISVIEQKSEDEAKINIVKDLEALYNLVMSEGAIQALDALGQLDEAYFSDNAKRLYKNIKAFENEVINLGRSGVSLLQENGIQVEDLNLKSKGFHTYFEKLRSFNGSTFNLSKNLSDLRDSEVFAHKQASASARNAVQRITFELIQLIDRAIILSTDGYQDYLLEKAVLGQIHLIALISRLRETIDDICKERNILPISSFNKIVSEALKDEPVAFIYEHIGGRFRHLMIDEFQDTSELQWHNLLPLVEESIAQGNTALIVGDAKQSIYRWRGGKAEQFISLPEFQEQGPTVSPVTKQRLSEAHTLKILDTNYRSLENIVIFNNLLVQELGVSMTTEGSIFRKEYTSESAIQKAAQNKTGGYVEVNYTGKQHKNDNTYLSLLLAQIQQALADGYKLNDIAILLRSTSTDGSEIASFLEEHNIPVATNDGYSLESNPWVMCLLSLLRLVLYPKNTDTQVRIMRSLCALKGIKYEPWRYVVHSNKEKTLDVNRFLLDNKLKALSNWKSFPDAFTCCEQFILTYLPEKQNDLYVKSFLTTIIKRGGTGVSIEDFLEWWDALRVKPGVPTDLDSNRVQMMTIHKAKGLQFKVCILPKMSWQIKNYQDNIAWIKTANRNVGLPYAPLKITKTLIQMGFEKDFQEDEEASKFDSLNMIYVAATRAEERLYITFDTYHSRYTGNLLITAFENILGKMKSNKNFIYDILEEKDGAKPFSIRFGNAQKTQEPKLSEGHQIQLKGPASRGKLWRERFEIAIPDSLRNDAGARRTGNTIHEILSSASTLDEAENILSVFTKSALISTSEEIEIAGVLQAVYNDARYVDLHQGARRFSERELLSQGRTLRPDLVLENETSVAVIDFKSGSENASHTSQVARYMDVLSSISNKPVQGYVLYLNPLKWLEVDATDKSYVQTSLFE